MAREKKISQTAATAKEELFNKLGIRQNIDITKLEYNEGQIEGLSKNPRWLHDDEGKKLKKSLIDSPEFLEYKPLMVYAMDNGNYVTICGNMRLRIANELRLDGHSEFDTLPCVILKADTPIEKIKEYAIKDNVQAGNWDWNELGNGEWEVDDLKDWGVDCSFLNTDEDDTDIDELFEDAQNTESKVKDIKLSVHIPQELEDKVDEIKEIIKSAVSEYEGVEIK
nr:MAG TPA: Stage 0 sporulation protein J, Chromosome segregation, Chromosome organization [Caudoviricetes sp.]